MKHPLSLKPAVITVFLAMTATCLTPACDCWADGPCCEEGCPDKPPSPPWRGQATLLARSTHDDYEAATFSFEHATVIDSELVRNDWDLLFGNDRDPDRDEFRVNTVTDDRSFIVDLGAIDLDAVPETVDPDEHPVGTFGEHDCVPVVCGHTYLVRTRDTETRQVAAFRVIAHHLNDSVTLRWVRSPLPDRYVLPTDPE